MGLITEQLPGTLEHFPGGSLLISSLDSVLNWSRSNSLWPLTFGTKCCAIEMMMSAASSHHDMARFGSEVARPSPRQADMIVLAGTIVKRMAPRLRRLYEQMAEPRYVIATGACTISGGPFIYNNYSVIRGADEIIPVDVYVPGCPPRPEAFLYGLMTLQKMIRAGETIRRPGIRNKPVFAQIPAGMSAEDIHKEFAELLKQDATVDMAQASRASKWREVD